MKTKTVRIIPASTLTILPVGSIASGGGSLVLLRGTWKHLPVPAASIAAIVVKKDK